MPFNIFSDEGTPEEVFERTENVNSDSIICETLTIAPDKDWRQLGIYPPLLDLIGYFKF